MGLDKEFWGTSDMDSDTGSDKNSDKINSVTLDTDSDKAKLKTSDSGTSSDTRKPLTSAYFYLNYFITNMSFIYIIYKNIRPYKNKKAVHEILLSPSVELLRNSPRDSG